MVRIFVVAIMMSQLIVGQALADSTKGSFPSFLSGTALFFVVGMAVYFFLVIKPTQDEEENNKKFISSLKKGDEVIISESILARVVLIEENFITVNIGGSTNIKVLADSLRPLPKNKS